MIADAPDQPPMLRRRLPLLGAALVGAAAVAFGWTLTGGGGGPPAASLEQDPGIPPPDYVYLDNSRVLLYLGQIEGGLTASEKQTAAATQERSAGAAASGLQLGASTGSSLSVERDVTPTATSRFYRLLDRLRARGYLHSIDAAAAPASLVRSFAAIPEGTFVQLRNCTLHIPDYVQLALLLRRAHGRVGPYDALVEASNGKPLIAIEAQVGALMASGRLKRSTGAAGYEVGPAVQRRVAAAERQLVAAAGPNPWVPLASCDGTRDIRPRGADLLIPIQLGELTPEQSLLDGPVTVVGKVVRAVRHGRIYVDDASLATFNDAVTAIGDARNDDQMLTELKTDVTVLSPGAVILPIAIYK